MLRDMLGWPAKGMHRDRARTSSALYLQTTQQPQRAASPSPLANPERGPGEGNRRGARPTAAGSGRGAARQTRAGGRRARCRVVP